MKINWENIEKNIAHRKWQFIEEGIYLVGKTYYIAYSHRNIQHKETTKIKFISAKKTNIELVRRKLAIKLGEIAKGEYSFLKTDKVTFDDLAEDIIRDYENNNYEVWRLKICLNHLAGFFKGVKAIHISSDMVMKEYVDHRRKQDPYIANATLNAELAALIRMFTLAMECDPKKISHAPKIKKFSVKGNQRTGFFEIADYIKMKNALPEYLVPGFMLAYKSGMRKEEIYSILIDQYDPIEKQLILEPLDTKTKEPRTLKLDPEMDAVIRGLIEERNKKFPSCEYIFFNKEGVRIRNYRESWSNALIQAGYGLKFVCKKCGEAMKFDHEPSKQEKVCKCGCTELRRNNKVFHDLRRSGIRNLIRSGVSEKVAMLISGHKTKTILDRYNITSEQDLEDAAIKSFEYQKKKEAEYLKSIQPVEPEPSLSQPTDSQEQQSDKNIVSLSKYRKKKVS